MDKLKTLNELHSNAIFLLVSINKPTLEVLMYSCNQHLVLIVYSTYFEITYSLNIRLQISLNSQSRYTLATIKRSGANITVEGANISRIHCSFKVYKSTYAIMLQDWSSG